MSDDPNEPLLHLDAEGRARMIDIGAKAETARSAEAQAFLVLPAKVRAALLAGRLPKGEAMATARLAGILAAKATASLIPLCHPLPLTSIEVGFNPVGQDRVQITAVARCTGRTGVEMEALTAVSVAALTLYDMVKGLTKDLRITDLELLAKSGGRSGDWRNPAPRDGGGS